MPCRQKSSLAEPSCLEPRQQEHLAWLWRVRASPRRSFSPKRLGAVARSWRGRGAVVAKASPSPEKHLFRPGLADRQPISSFLGQMPTRQVLLRSITTPSTPEVRRKTDIEAL